MRNSHEIQSREKHRSGGPDYTRSKKLFRFLLRFLCSHAIIKQREGRQMQLLLVEDDAALRKLLAKRLAQEGYVAPGRKMTGFS